MNSVSYQPSYLINKKPSRFGGHQTEYVEEACRIIQETAEKIAYAREKGSELTKLFFEIIVDLSKQRAEIAKKHQTYKCEDFGKRREELDPRSFSFLELEDVYRECGDKFIDFFSDILAKMESNGTFKKKHTITDKCSGLISTLEIEVLDTKEFCSQLPEHSSDITAGLPREEVQLQWKKLKLEHPDQYRKLRMEACNALFLEQFPDPLYLENSPESIRQQYSKEKAEGNKKSLYVHALLRTQVDGKLYAMTDYFTWMYEHPDWVNHKKASEHPIVRMKKHSRVMLVHQDVSLIEKTLIEISKIFEKAVVWNKSKQSIQELKNLMAHFCYLSSHNMRDIRGTAAENEWLEQAIYISHGMQLSTDQRKMVDLEAFANPLFSRFQKAYDQMTVVTEFKECSLDVLLQKCLQPTLEKWNVNLPKVESYRKNTNDFGIEVLELLLAARTEERLTKTFDALITLAKRLGIKIKRTKHTVPVRDYLFRLHTGETKRQLMSEHCEKATSRAQSKALYFNEKGFTRSSSIFFTMAVEGRIEVLEYVNNQENFFNEYVSKGELSSHLVGGNMFTLTNPKGEVKVLIGQDQLYSSLSIYRLAKSFDLSKISEETKEELKTEQILEIAEEMYAQGMLLQKKGSGHIDHNQIDDVLCKMSDNYPTIDKRGDNNFRQTAISLGLIRPFDTQNPEKCREFVVEYLLQKKLTTQKIASDLNVNSEDLVFVPQLNYHLDTFIKPGPNNSVFLANFSLCIDILQNLLDNAGPLKLSTNDTRLLKGYLITAEKRHKELGSLLKDIQNEISKAGFTVVPMPGIFMCDKEPLGSYSTHHINFVNALSGWSSKINNYYYITTGAKVGDKLGDIFMEVFKQFLESYQPRLEVHFLGGAEGMNQWNSLFEQAGIHCFSFESETASHTSNI